ncbi:MAG: segregation/condensation protein A [Chloroherpetonaceae bacterium]|nr:segregation/condensation protein A [Chthonomonadaceae bacterium]MDW8206493.1 segregation/condensation protein A [Chloroherpetonaceae bacterium]
MYHYNAMDAPAPATPSRTATLTLASPLPLLKTETFEGPLDLLLHLIRINQVDISDIPIAEITAQYLACIAMMEALDLTIAGEYLVVAATLIEIKSRLLLPAPPAPDMETPEDPRAELVARLREYERYRSAVETLRAWEDLRRQLYFRGTFESVDDYILPVAPGQVGPEALCAALRSVLQKAGVDPAPVTTVIPRRRLNLRLKMVELLHRLRQAGTAGLLFDQLFQLPCPRYDIVLTFLALLELIRLGRARAEQDALDATIQVYPVSPQGASEVVP